MSEYFRTRNSYGSIVGFHPGCVHRIQVRGWGMQEDTESVELRSFLSMPDSTSWERLNIPSAREWPELNQKRWLDERDYYWRGKRPI